MAQFKEGDKVLNVETKEHGRIVEVKRAGRGGHQNYLVSWGNREEVEQECDLQPDCGITDPFERFQNRIFDSYLDFSRRNTTYKIRNSNNSTISSLKASKTLFRPYQFKPLMKFLNSPNKRLLVADEVGLGKTIEAGHIMLELKSRNQLNNALVICPLSLQNKWKEELEQKFALYFKIYTRLEDLVTDLRAKNSGVKGIINYEKIRIKDDDDKGNQKNVLLDFIQKTDYAKFDFILCDEAHKLRNNEAKQYKGAEILLRDASSVVFLTATPVMLDNQNLYNLLHLLDREKYSDLQIFLNLLRENTPFVEALTELNEGVPMKEIAEKLKNSKISLVYQVGDKTFNLGERTVDDKFNSFPLYQRIMQRMTNEKDEKELRAKVQFDLSNMSVMNNIFSRTRKKEVTTDLSLAKRKPHPCIIKLSDDEQDEFDRIIEEYYDDNSYVDYWGDITLSQGASLGLVQKKRLIASSVYAYLNDEKSLDQGIDQYADCIDAKVEKLKEIINEVFSHGKKKLIVFTLFHKTIKYLGIRLKKLGYGCEMIYGPTKNRHEILKKFRTDPNCNILLSSEVGSEGLDMQFCNAMVNYDLPWNPMVLEQRIGRIDRFGQKSPVVNIYNMVVAGSIQEEIYTRLLDRIGIFRGTIGDMEAILDAEVERHGRGSRTISQLYSSLEKDLYCSKLTEAERQQRIEDVERAIVFVKEQTRRLEKDLTNSLTNDRYFRDEIDKILRNKSYVTENEIHNYFVMLIRECLTTCYLDEVEKDIYEIKVPKSNERVFQNFLTANQPAGEEIAFAFRQFKEDIREREHIYITFSQQKAYEDRDLVFVNVYHPIIVACLNYFVNSENKDQKTFSFPLLEDGIVKRGEEYVMAVYQLTVTRQVQGKVVKSETLKPFVFDIHSGCCLTDNTVIDHIYGESQNNGLQKEVTYNNLTDDIIEDMTSAFVESISNERKLQTKEIKLQIDNEKKQNVLQTQAYFESRKRSVRNTINDYKEKLEWATYDSNDKAIKNATMQINTNTGRLKKLEEEEQDRIAQIESVQNPVVTSELISLNYIPVIPCK